MTNLNKKNSYKSIFKDEGAEERSLESSKNDYVTAEKNISAILAYNVKRLRERNKFSKVRFCDAACISRPFLDKIESGKSDPQLSMLVDIANALGVTVKDLITPPFDDVSLESYIYQVQKL